MRSAPERHDPATGKPIPKTCPTFDARGRIRSDARTYRRLSLDRVALNTTRGRVGGQLVLGDCQRRSRYETAWKIGGAELVRRDDGW